MKTFRLVLYFTFSILHFTISSAQTYDPSKINKKAVALYEQAMSRVEKENFASAAGLLLQAIEADKNYVDAYLVLADIYGRIKNYKSSIQYFEKAFALDSVYTIGDKFSYSKQLAGIGEFDKALSAINELLAKKPPKNPVSLEKMEKRRRSYQFAVDYEKTHQAKNYVFAPQNLGNTVNSAESEYFPTLSIEGNELIFTRRINDSNEDFYTSDQKNNHWENATSIEGNINTPQSEAAQTVSADGQWLIFTARDRKDSYGNYDLYFSQYSPWGWGDAVNLGGVVNSDQWDAQPCLSPDKRDLYFASRRFGGFGGSDIYVCHLKANGRWTEPENLGGAINTPGDDQCPFIHADNQTLYFTSNGWQGYGENDIFYVRKGYNGTWSKPVNLGYPINTIDDEGTLYIAADGKTAYYASDRSDSKGGLDIYTFELRQDIRPFKTVWVKGHVQDVKTKITLAAGVQLIDLASRQIINEVQADESGYYFITIPLGKDYAFSVNRKGYLFYSDNFLMAGRSPDSIYEKNILLQPIETNAIIILKNIFFDVNKFELKPESQVELDKLVQLLTENPALKIEISGHTDNVGKPADNLLLSNNRAKAVVNYLISKNIATPRLTAKGFGETKPVADNKTEEGRSLNRRTEMK
ncbi:MAG TPA: OmpA family protein, partial [Chitinophagaceae bacterium]|nr:OmpA family protein [Chitinophagaceae bacterium]